MQENIPAVQAAPLEQEPPKAPEAKKPGVFKRFLYGIGRFCKKHKVLTALIAIVAVIAIVLTNILGQAKAAVSAAYSFVRTTTLSKGDLTDTVSATGTVESANTSTVTYAVSGVSAAPKFKTVNVAVGDTVAAGDVIATLDTGDIEESIAKEKENIAQQVKKAQDSVTEAQAAYTKATDTAAAAETTLNNANSTLATATTNYNNAVAAVSTAQAAYDSAKAAQEVAQTGYNGASTALSDYNNAVAAEKSAQETYDAAYAAWNVDDSTKADSALTLVKDNASAALDAAKAETAAKSHALNDARDTADANFAAADAALKAAKSSAHYDEYQSAYESASTKRQQARTALDQAEESVTNAQKTLANAKDTLADASTSDTLENLQDSLADCSLKAETSGKVTSLTASVGDTPAGTVATIQDTDALKVSITISQSDINKIETGMACQITTDATDETISGTLTQIDPVADQSGAFGAEVTVNGTNASLKIGMNATVKIVLSNTSDCFTVPLDAIGNDDDGEGDYVLRKTGGEGTDLTFEKVYVTTGNENDYYVEITSDDLSEGDIIRSSSDLSQGIVSTDASDDLSALMGEGHVTVSDGSQGGGDMGGGTPPQGGQGGPGGQ